MDIEEIKKKVIEHEREINYKELEKINEIKKYINSLFEKIEEIKKYIEKLEVLNIKEFSGKYLIKEDELEILYNVFSLYSELNKVFSDFYKKLIEYYMLLEKEII